MGRPARADPGGHRGNGQGGGRWRIVPGALPRTGRREGALGSPEAVASRAAAGDWRAFIYTKCFFCFTILKIALKSSDWVGGLVSAIDLEKIKPRDGRRCCNAPAKRTRQGIRLLPAFRRPLPGSARGKADHGFASYWHNRRGSRHCSILGIQTPRPNMPRRRQPLTTSRDIAATTGWLRKTSRYVALLQVCRRVLSAVRRADCGFGSICRSAVSRILARVATDTSRGTVARTAQF